MTKSEFEKLPSAKEMFDALLSTPTLDNDPDAWRLFNKKAHEEFVQSVIEVFGSYDPEIHYDFSKRKKD